MEKRAMRFMAAVFWLILVGLAVASCANGGTEGIAKPIGSAGATGTTGTGGTRGTTSTTDTDTTPTQTEVLCGNGVIDVGEECDGLNVGSEDCETQGMGGGTLGCTDCRFDTTMCSLVVDDAGDYGG